MYQNVFAQDIGRMAVEAMLCEVSATPKPGLVDRNNCGAHNDMDFFTFMASSAALHNVFDEFVQLGQYLDRTTAGNTLHMLQRYGMKAEKLMFHATNGINTHKGMIFSLGLVCSATGWIQSKAELSIDNICNAIQRLCNGLCNSAYRGLEHKENLTKGERMYLQHGFTGVRGEAESGYVTVREVSLPVFSQLMEAGQHLNDALVHTLLHLIAHTTDTNIASRHNLETAQYARNYARTALEHGGMFTENGQALIRKMDDDFIAKYISPGGSADLLAVTYLLYSIDQTYSTLIDNEVVTLPVMAGVQE